MRTNGTVQGDEPVVVPGRMMKMGACRIREGGEGGKDGIEDDGGGCPRCLQINDVPRRRRETRRRWTLARSSSTSNSAPWRQVLATAVASLILSGSDYQCEARSWTDVSSLTLENGAILPAYHDVGRSYGIILEANPFLALDDVVEEEEEDLDWGTWTPPPTAVGTAVPTAEPTADPVTPTVAPTLPSTRSPTEKSPVSSMPTSAPVSTAPTPAPVLINPAKFPVYSCPSTKGAGVDGIISHELPPYALRIRLRVPSDGALCTLTRLTPVMRDPNNPGAQSGGGGGRKDTLAGVGRSYSGYDWESVAGPHPSLNYDCASIGESRSCAVILPELNEGQRYALTAFPSRSSELTERDRAARYLERATFGTTRADVRKVLTMSPTSPAVSSNTIVGAAAVDDVVPKVALWAYWQMDPTLVPPSSHRAHYRRRLNPPYDEVSAVASQTHPCKSGTRYRRRAFSSRDRDLTLRIVAIEMPRGSVWGNGTVYGLYVNKQLRTVVRDVDWYGADGRRTYIFDKPAVGSPKGVSYEICSTIRHPGADLGGPISLRDKDGMGYCGRGTLLRYTPLEKIGSDAGANDKYTWPPMKSIPRGAYGTEFSIPADPTKGTLAKITGNPPVVFVEGLLEPEYRVDLPMESLTDVETPAPDIKPPPGSTLEIGRLTEDLDDLICVSLPAEARTNRRDRLRRADVFGKMADGTWYAHDPRPVLVQNTLESPMTVHGIGSGAVGAGEDGSMMGGMAGMIDEREVTEACPNAPRTFLNEGHCRLAKVDACNPPPEMRLSVALTEDNLRKIYEGTLGGDGNAVDASDDGSGGTRYVYVVDGLRIQPDSGTDPPCSAGRTSRFAPVPSSECSADADALRVHEDTIKTLSELLKAEKSSNSNVVDILFPPRGYCHPDDVSKKSFVVPLGDGTCFRHVHQDHLQVYDMTYWTRWDTHPGNYEDFQYNPIRAFAKAGSGMKLYFPSSHGMSRWTSNKDNFGEVGRLGDVVQFEELPEGLRTDSVARLFGGGDSNDAEGDEERQTPTLVCGSPDEVSNDPSARGSSYDGSYDFAPNDKNSKEMNLQRSVVWYDIALNSPDQLRQRMAWALSQILAISPFEIKDADRYDTEQFLTYYDIFVRNAFGNYRDVLREVAYSSLMAEMLSYSESRSTEYHLTKTNRIIYPDENFAREVMQLFTVGMHLLRADGTPILGGKDGATPVRTYTNDDIMSLARAWTGFDRQSPRGNVEDFPSRQNRIDPMRIVIEWRDRHPKLGLEGRYVGERYPLCRDLPKRHFLRKGAKFRLLGGSSTPEWLNDDPKWDNDEKIVRVELGRGGKLYAELCQPDGSGECQFASTVVLDSNLKCDGMLCDIDHLRVVQVIPGIYYEYVRPPCVEHAFFDGGRKVKTREGNVAACADSLLSVASAACCYPSELSSRAVWASRYVGERMSYGTAAERCESVGRVPCDFSSIGIVDENNAFPFDQLEHVHWTDANCEVKAMIEPSDGSVAIVHDPFGGSDVLRHVRRDTPMFFHAVWDEGTGATMPSPENNCGGMPLCEIVANEGRCLCQTTVVEKRAFRSMPRNPEDALARLRVGAPDPTSFDDGTWIVEPADGSSAEGLIVAYHRRDDGTKFSARTVFKVTEERTGRTFFLKNVISVVRVGVAADSVSVAAAAIPLFRNPPHFVSLVDREKRDGHYETNAVIDQYVYHPNTAPFLAFRFIQRFGISNPSPGYVWAVATAFRRGSFTEPLSGQQFGSGSYGDLAATCAAVLLGRETSFELESDPTYGSLREPLLKVVGLMRSLEFRALDNYPFVKLLDMTPRIGQAPHEIPSVFSFFLPEFEARGLTTAASLVVPEAQHLTGPKIINTLNGFFSLIKWGLLGYWNGFGQNRDDGQRNRNVQAGDYWNSVGRLTFPPLDSATSNGLGTISELSSLLTAGRLSKDNMAAIESAYKAEAATNATKGLLLAQQLITSSAEFHSTGLVKRTLEKRSEPPSNAQSPRPYKALIMLTFEGGIDSYNMLVPGCNGTSRSYDEYAFYRGELALQKHEVLPIDASASPSSTICDTFGLHDSLKSVQESYASGDTVFFANIGALNRAVTKSNYLEETRTQLFAHNQMITEVKQVDPYRKAPGTGVLGRLTDTLTALKFRTGPFCIEENSAPTLSGQPGVSPPSVTVSRYGVTPFDEKSHKFDELDVIPSLEELHGSTGVYSSLFGETWSSSVLTAITQNKDMEHSLGSTTLSADFPKGALSEKFQIISKLIKSQDQRGTDRDVFYASYAGWDHHKDMKHYMRQKLDELDPVLDAFRTEMKAQGKWDQVVLVTASDFGRTLTPNSMKGSDHAWGGHYFAMGGSVKGKRILGDYPKMLNDFPQDLFTLGPLNVDRGRMIPTHSNDAIWNAIAQWMGVAEEHMLDEVLPNRKDCGSPMFHESDVFDIPNYIRK